MGRRIRWGILDQAISSLTNLGIGVVVARAAQPEEFGTFSLAFTLYVLCLWISRSLATDTFVVRLTVRPEPEQRAAARQATGAAVAAGVVSGLALAVVAVAGSALTRRIFLPVALSMVGLLVQDSYRYVLFTIGRARAAAVNDSVWFIAEAALIGALYATGHVSAWTATAAFGIGAAVAALLGAWQTKVIPSVRHSYAWIVEHRDLAAPYLLELITVAGMVQVALVTVAAVSGARAIGALRAGMLLLGPLTVLFLGALVTGVPEAIRYRERSEHGLARMVLSLGIALPLVTVLLAAVILVLPTRLGTDLLGPNWGPARHVVPAVAVMVAGQGCGLAAIVGLRALGAAKTSLGARLWGAPVFLAGGVIGAAVGNALGAAVGLAVAAWFDAGLVWVAFQRANQVGTASVARQGAGFAPPRSEGPN